MSTLAMRNRHVTFVFLSTIMAILVSSGAAGNVLITGQTLQGSQNLTYRAYSLSIQSYCNLVLKNGTTTIWQTGGIYYSRDCRLDLLGTGELILWSPSRRYIVWRSGSASDLGNYVLVLRFDGTLRIYGPRIWQQPLPFPKSSSSSAVVDVGQQPTSSSSSLSSITTTDSALYSGDVAPIGTTIVNGGYELVLQRNCNLALSRKADGAVFWESGVTEPPQTGRHDCFTRVELNGELRVNHWGGEVLWSNGVTSSTYDEHVLAISSNGEIGVYKPSIWSSGLSRAPAVATTTDKIDMVVEA